MKSILLILIMLITCSCEKKIENREVKAQNFKNKAEKCCSCHNGIAFLSFNDYVFLLVCKDGMGFSGKGYISGFYFDCGCKD